ncbi:hypothetical protein ACO2Q7_12620 [Rathayibacter sp. KR2-224]|uniref:hypothetical protein n=1 Tax=Rathayibacter sp. KR2-224 TaxID=3400913 RepID=UPI003C02C2AD
MDARIWGKQSRIEKPTGWRHPQMNALVLARPDSPFPEHAHAIEPTADGEGETRLTAEMSAGVEAAARSPHAGVRA